MIRTMIDTDRPLDLTAGADLIATYADLASAAVTTHLATLCHRVLFIDRGLGDPGGIASVYDCETGANDAAGFHAWLVRKHAAHVPHPTGYCDRSNLAALHAGAAGQAYDLWVATLDGTAHIAGYSPGHGPAAIQCLSAAMLGFHADGSLVFHDGWHRTP